MKLPEERQSLKRKENLRRLPLLGIQTGDTLAKPPFFVAYSRLCGHCRSLAEGGCRLSRFHFRLCRYFLGHVACRNFPWQGLSEGPVFASLHFYNNIIIFNDFFLISVVFASQTFLVKVTQANRQMMMMMMTRMMMKIG